MMTTTASGRARLISASVSRPSIRSIQMSRNVSSGSSSAKNRSASAPLPTAETRYPSSSRTSRRVDRMAGSSSTIKMCSPAMSGLDRVVDKVEDGALDVVGVHLEQREVVGVLGRDREGGMGLAIQARDAVDE